MMSQFNICFGPYHDLLASLTVHLEQWVFQALFARALARGLQNPLWWSRRRYI
ncbi:rCG25611, isoform CRA_c [Rattus norvegicus]|uniref:RCG25611, isoform CRA_c n=1 Tax=Rattus norvegicus TaxID=10116 RepID=A6I1I8_RAT|nr:rCG25611, isoform CRA_c [Rattus norvegicus]